MRRSDQRNKEFAKRIIEQLPSNVRATFTPIQMAALYETLSNSQTRHLVDIRFLVPVFSRRFYFVCLIGRDRRPRQRVSLRQAVLARLILLAVALAGCGAVFGLSQLYRMTTPSIRNQPVVDQGKSFHPATLPFKRNQEACETDGRQWEDGQCVDYEHDPSF
ncbi:MAG: hypothetical protein F6J97_07560 [Leptolyngbya sp. SIO4C1]|nr:hypothetical protein [Leptolyngbya sp. SIO4C1]